MNWHIEARWDSLKGQLKRTFGKPVEIDSKTSRRKGHLIDKVQARYGVEKVEAERRVDAWLDALASASPKKH